MRVGERSARTFWMAALFILAGATVLRLETLGARPLWADERAVQAFVAQAGREGFRAAARVQAGRQTEAQLSPLHVAVVVATTRVLGDSPVALRLPSALASLAIVALTIALGGAVFGPRAGLVAGALAAISPYQIEYAQDARSYALFVALTTAQLYAWFRYAATHRTVWLAALGACGVAAIYTHHLGLLCQAALAVIAVATAVRDRLATRVPGALGRREMLAVAATFAAIGASYLPQLESLQGFARSGVAEPLALLAPSPRFLLELAGRWGGGSGAAAWLYALCFAVGALAGVRHGRANLALVWWIACPIAVFSLVPFSKFFDVRYLMPGQPAFLVLVAHGAVTLFDVARARLARLAGLAPAHARLAAAACAAALALAFFAPAASGYLAFRRLPLRCSEFFLEPRILDLAGGFCRRHIVLNSLVPEQRYLLRAAAPLPPVERDGDHGR